MPYDHDLIPTTPFPNHLLDTVMPTLKDSEWRLLCVIVRQTLGWRGERTERRKESDWLTHSQLKSRTGRSSEAVSHALDALVRRNLIEVRGDQRELLATPKARRCAAGRLNFRLCPQVLAATEAEAGSIPKTGKHAPKSEAPISETGIRKAKTTKETDDKKTPDGGERQSTSEDGRVEPKEMRKRIAARGDAPDPDVRRFLNAYREMFAMHSTRGETPPISWGKDGKLAKNLLAQYGYERLLELLERFFQSNDTWVKKRGFALSCLPTVLPALLMEDGGKRPVQTVPLVIHSDAPWIRGDNIAVANVSLFERFPDLARRVREQPPREK